MRSTPTCSRIGTSDGPDEARADVALARPVLARLQRHLLDDGQAPLALLRADRVAHAVEEVVERAEEVGHPRGALLGEHELQIGVTVEHAPDDEVGEHVVRPPRDLEQEHHDVFLLGPADRARAAAVVVDRHAELLAHRPDRLVVLVVERQQPAAGGRAGEQDAAGEPVVVRPADLLHRRVDVVEQDLRDAGATSGRAGAEVGQPAVVRLQPGPAQFEVVRVGRAGPG